MDHRYRPGYLSGRADYKELQAGSIPGPAYVFNVFNMLILPFLLHLVSGPTPGTDKLIPARGRT